MDFEFSEKSQRMQGLVQAFIAEHVAPRDAECAAARGGRRVSRRPSSTSSRPRRARRACGICSCPGSSRTSRARRCRISITRPAPRSWAACRLVVGGLQLQRARHRQHGAAASRGDAGAEGAMADAAARRPHPLVLRHDRARCRLVRRDQHPHLDRGATATTGSSTGANGSSPTPPIRAPRSSSSWARPSPDRPEAHRRQSMVLVPRDTPGLTIVRNPPVMHERHRARAIARCCSRTCACRPRISSARKAAASRWRRRGSARAASITACARIGAAELALELMVERALERRTFGQMLHEHGTIREWIALSRIEIEQARLLVLQGRVADRQARQQGGAARGLADQGDRAAHRGGDRQPRHAGLRRQGPDAGHAAARHLDARPLSADRRRAGRSASARIARAEVRGEARKRSRQRRAKPAALTPSVPVLFLC